MPALRFLLVVSVWLGLSAPAMASVTDLHQRLYGGAPLEYTVLRNDAPVGTHRVSFREVDGQLAVDSVFEISISFLFFSYDYSYRSTGYWQGGELRSLDAVVDDNGDQSVVRGRRVNGAWVINGPKGQQQVSAAPALFATTHWNPNVLGVDRILNTITGQVADVVMEDRGTELVPVGSGQQEGRYWAYTGGLETETWYDEEGRWLGMRFKGKDGSIFRVVLKRPFDLGPLS